MWLNKGIGECLLKYEPLLNVVDDAINFYVGKLYDLYDYVIMPNHVHLLIVPYEFHIKAISLLKSYTAKRINRLTGRTGGLWQKDFFDRMIRSVKDFEVKALYIRCNPESFNPTLVQLEI